MPPSCILDGQKNLISFVTCCRTTHTISVFGHICVRHADKKTNPGSGRATIYYPWKITKRSIIQNEAQTISLGVMIGRCTLDSQHGRFDRHPATVGWSSFRYTNDSSFRYTNDEQISRSHQRPQRKKWSREDNIQVLHCYFRSHPT